ncbi:hypothetical protein L914_13115 [Phytophthora nicotianae]|uniref:C-factor n=1 Tax=Phytophthora nicotianae TaxID=4792 RepID=W2MXI0_PHYNI|nr:hypothetical protein L914_13115 [Phytophthora nicotianae]
MPPHFSKRLQLGKFPVQPPTLYTLATISTITTILTTGSTRGIGLAFTKHYAKAGWNVIDTAPCHSVDLQPSGIVVVSVHPGYVDTDMTHAEA